MKNIISISAIVVSMLAVPGVASAKSSWSKATTSTTISAPATSTWS